MTKSESMKVKVARMEQDIQWLKNMYRSLDHKTWGILAGIIIIALLQIVFQVV